MANLRTETEVRLALAKANQLHKAYFAAGSTDPVPRSTTKSAERDTADVEYYTRVLELLDETTEPGCDEEDQ